jgi:peptidoglycan hydrolase-like protein with peptidoglycan-binding domain
MTDSRFPIELRPSPDEPPAEAAPRRRRAAAIIVVAAALAAVAVSTVVVVSGAPVPDPVAHAAETVSTVPVATGTIVSSTNARGTLHYAREAPLAAAANGVVTALPTPGSVIAPGAALYRVNDQPVILLRGATPAWRPFETGMAPGEDVRQLEQNLAAFGKFRGTADATFTRATADAIRAWQKAVGVERTGRIDRTTILFADHDLRVTTTTAALGAEVAPGTELYRVSATEKVVDLDLRLGDQGLAIVGNPVGITLPDGATTTGSIASVGEPVERATDSAPTDTGATSGTFVVPVTVALSDQAAGSAFPRASVSVQFSSTLAEGALTVPVEALVAVDASSFAIETPTKGNAAVRRIPVTLGAFSSGRVQITGDGIAEGLPVVVPES